MKLHTCYYQRLYGTKALFRRRGYGVHSPFLYKLFTQVVASPTACYYAELLFKNEPLVALFYRLGVSYPLLEVKLSKTVPLNFSIAADLLKPQIKVSPERHPCGPFAKDERYFLQLFGEGEEIPPENEIPAYYIALILRGREPSTTRDQIVKKEKRGIEIPLKRATLFVRNPQLTNYLTK